MIFQKLLANREYTVLLRTESFLFIMTSNNHYVFYMENNELKCFHVQAFRNISQLQFFELNYSMSHLELISVQNTDLSVNLNFENEALTKILGKCFRLKNIQNIAPENIINEESLRFVEDFSHVIPTVKWKFCVEEQHYYFIPKTSYCVKFNSNVFYTYGDDNYKISRGTTNHLYFLNPYTLFQHYQAELPNLETDSIYIGTPTDKEEKANIVIRGTKKELLTSFQTFCQRHSLPFTIDHKTITLHVVNENYSDFFNQYYPDLFQALKNDYTYFQLKTSFNVEYKNSIVIKPTKLHDKLYPTVEFVNDSSRLQIVIDFLLNKLFPQTTYILNTTYNPISSLEHEQSDFEEIPDDAIIESNLY